MFKWQTKSYVQYFVNFLFWALYSDDSDTWSDVANVTVCAFHLRKFKNQHSQESLWHKPLLASGPGSVVGILTGTGWTVRGSNPGGVEIFHTCPDRPCGPPSLLYNGYRAFPGGKKLPGRDADSSSPSSAVVMKGYSYTSTPPTGRTACTEPQCL
jgi:hypothetical protein